jgi:hypothetical protein
MESREIGTHIDALRTRIALLRDEACAAASRGEAPAAPGIVDRSLAEFRERRVAALHALGAELTALGAEAARAAAAGARREVAVAPGLSLEAIVLPDTLAGRDEVYARVRLPELYFVPRWGHFAARVGGTVFHGNVGEVLLGDRGRPARVKECRRRGACPPGCAHYHDPARGGEKRDVRNFRAESWLYAAAEKRGRVRYGARHVGARSQLGADLLTVSAAGARRRLDQTAHDILCALLLAKYVLKGERGGPARAAAGAPGAAAGGGPRGPAAGAAPRVAPHKAEGRRGEVAEAAGGPVDGADLLDVEPADLGDLGDLVERREADGRRDVAAGERDVVDRGVLDAHVDV